MLQENQDLKKSISELKDQIRISNSFYKIELFPALCAIPLCELKESEDGEFICDVLAMIDRMEKEHRKKAKECRLEQKQELELARIETRWKTENETRIREARRKEEMEARLKAEEEATL
ncbi:hypothetical protein TNIN_191761 [Trichonephila inaurata madagascariensis]|uniref:Uncharacterized protein n=1 Tax=Trichonephila inaurata madagascariensis TaxID=2747483 RepID=A0A8X6MIK3_9ARAC|nr:hypothetical protein TNIN_191761 [Trichonephila inaurata madagascariensis]